jgi:diketogulonate reductase-like aldo/keto reductase
VGEISEETGKSYAQIALNWLLRQEGVTAPIIGARHVEQLEDNLGAAGGQPRGRGLGAFFGAGRAALRGERHRGRLPIPHDP